MLLKKYFGLKGEVRGGWGKLGVEELHDLTPNQIVFFSENQEAHLRFCWRHLMERDHLEDISVCVCLHLQNAIFFPKYCA
jgi:hypothetical protein